MATIMTSQLMMAEHDRNILEIEQDSFTIIVIFNLKPLTAINADVLLLL